MADFERRVRNYRPAPRALRRRRSGPVRARPTAVRVMSQGSCLVSGHRWAPGKCVTIGNCADLGAVMLIDLPPGYRMAGWPIGRWDQAAATVTTAAARGRRSAMAPRRIFLLTVPVTVLTATTPVEIDPCHARWQACCRRGQARAGK